MEISTIGYRPEQDHLSHAWSEPTGRDRAWQEVLTQTTLDLHRNPKPMLFGMEACAGAHNLARALRDQGHDARLMPAQYVKP